MATDDRGADGRPCLIPAHVDTSDRLIEGFITRLDRGGATLTLDGSLENARELFVYFRRPEDGRHVAMRSKVVGVIPDAGLWRGHPAVRVRFAIGLDRALTAEDSLDLRFDDLAPELDDAAEELLTATQQPRPGERVLTQIPVQFQLEGRLLGGYASDFGRGGLFVSSRQRPEPGTRIHVHFPVPLRNGETHGVAFTAEVRWRPDPTGDEPGRSGFGVRIDTFDDETAERLYRSFVDQLLGPEAPSS